MVAVLRHAIIDKVEDITRISRGWVVLAHAHSASGRSQLGLFPWPGFHLLDGAETALAQFTRDEPESGEKIAKAEKEYAILKSHLSRKLEAPPRPTPEMSATMPRERSPAPKLLPDIYRALHTTRSTIAMCLSAALSSTLPTTHKHDL